MAPDEINPRDREYEAGDDDPEIGVWEPSRPRPGQHAALSGRNFFGIRGLVIGGVPVDDLVVVNSRRLEFSVPSDAASGDVVLEYETRREPEMEVTVPNMERPTTTLRWSPPEEPVDGEETSTLRRLIRNAERLFRR